MNLPEKSKNWFVYYLKSTTYMLQFIEKYTKVYKN